MGSNPTGPIMYIVQSKSYDGSWFTLLETRWKFRAIKCFCKVFKEFNRKEWRMLYDDEIVSEIYIYFPRKEIK